MDLVTTSSSPALGSRAMTDAALPASYPDIFTSLEMLSGGTRMINPSELKLLGYEKSGDFDHTPRGRKK